MYIRYTRNEAMQVVIASNIALKVIIGSAIKNVIPKNSNKAGIIISPFCFNQIDILYYKFNIICYFCQEKIPVLVRTGI